MDAAIGRLHLTITVAQPVSFEEPAPKEPKSKLERAFRRQRTQRAVEADRTAWSAEYHGRGRMI